MRRQLIVWPLYVGRRKKATVDYVGGGGEFQVKDLHQTSNHRLNVTVIPALALQMLLRSPIKSHFIAISNHEHRAAPRCSSLQTKHVYSENNLKPSVPSLTIPAAIVVLPGENVYTM